MKKTHKDRINLIDRLERKYMRKLQLKTQARRQNIKSALRTMRGRHFSTRDNQTESIEGIFARHNSRLSSL